jgi:chromosome segregation ATPase
MFGKTDLVEQLSRDLDRARDKRDALASGVTTLTTQITDLEARLSEERNRRERERVADEIEGIKKSLQDSVTAFAPVITKLCHATEAAAAVVAEASELNRFLIAAAAEVDNVTDHLVHELQRRAEVVRAGHAPLYRTCPSRRKTIIAHSFFHGRFAATRREKRKWGTKGTVQQRELRRASFWRFRAVRCVVSALR